MSVLKFPIRAAALALLLAAACGDPAAPPMPKPVAHVIVSPASRTVEIGSQFSLAVTLKSATGELLDRPVTWSSEDETVATVSASGLVKAIAAGDVAIRATSEGQFARAVITIVPIPPVPVAEVRISVDNEVVLAWNGETRISAKALDAQGNELTGRTVTWQSNRTNVVAVNDGALYAINPGVATITATIEGKVSSVGVRVLDAPITTVAIEGPTGLEVGDVVAFSSKITRANGQVTYAPVSWTSSAPGIIRVDNQDLWMATLEAVAEGTATITITRDGVSASLTLRVTPRTTADLIYNRWSGTASEIFTLGLAADGVPPVRINAGNVSREASPSPDGTQLVFAISQRTPMGEIQNDLYIVNRNGLNMRWLTRTDGIEDQPKWSPDGTKILFHGTTDRSDLFVINVDGTGLTNLTAGFPATMTDKRNPAWSADGSRIAFIGAVNGQHKVWVMNSDGTNARQVTTDAGFDQTPSFSPDGEQIVFARYNAAAPQLGDDVMIVSAAGGPVTRLALPGDQRTPAWSPDGRYIAISGTATVGSGQSEIYTLRPDGTGLKLRTINPAWGGGVSPAWIKR